MRLKASPLLAPVLVAGAVLWAFANSLDGAFLGDDGRSIVDNPHVPRLGVATLTRASRPLVQLGFALDHAAAGLDPRRYHLTWYAAALRIDPRQVSARNNLGVLLGRKGRLDQAIPNLEEVVRRAPDFVEGRYNLAVALRLAHRPAEARDQLLAVLALDPDHALARRSLERLDRTAP